MSYSPLVPAGLFRHPDVSEAEIAFVYAGDIWLVKKTGGIARRLTSIPGQEGFPRFSPQGDRVAFSANYSRVAISANIDLYSIPVDGGVPERLTYHPRSDQMVGWHPSEERLLFASDREVHNGSHRQLFEIPSGGGPANRLPIPFAETGSYSQDGRFLAFQMTGREISLWKGYRGGSTSDLFVLDQKSGDIQRITRSAANDAHPMWHGEDLYFLSDRTDRQSPEPVYNLFVLQKLAPRLARGSLSSLPRPKRLTRFDRDIRFPAMGPRDLVFSQLEQIYRVPLDVTPIPFEDPETLKIQVIPNRSVLVPEWQRVDDSVQSFDLSPDGKRLLVEARGSVFVVPVEPGPVRRIERAPTSVERSPAWLDDRWIVYHSDLGNPEKTTSAAGEYDLVAEDLQDGSRRHVQTFPAGFRYRISAAPAGRRLAFFEQTRTLSIVDFDPAKGFSIRGTAPVEGLTPYDLELQHPQWSPDGRFVLFSDRSPSGRWRIRAVDTEAPGDLETVSLTSGYFSERSPAFDPEGVFLLFVAERGRQHLRGELGGGSLAYFDTDRLVRVRLARPLAPPNEDGDTPEEPLPSLEEIFGEVDAFARNAEILPLAGRQIRRVLPLGEDRVLVDQDQAAAAGSGDLVLLQANSTEPQTLVSDPGRVVVSPHHSRGVVEQGEQLLALDLEAAIAGRGADAVVETIDTSGVAKVVDRRLEWHQMFRECWRLVRDFFHDPRQLQRNQWDQLYGRYEPLARLAATREELNVVMDEMYWQVGSSHTRVFGGDTEEVDTAEVGLLGSGLTWDPSAGMFRITDVQRAGLWEPEIRSPIVGADEIEAGSFLLAVDGVPLPPDREPWAAFLGKAGRTVRLTVRNPSSTEVKEAELNTLALGEERLLRMLAWTERNRAVVEERSAGRLGYVYIPNTGEGRQRLNAGRHLFEHQLRGQIHLDGLIFDVRFNRGGQIPYDMVEQIARRPLISLHDRQGPIDRLPVPSRFLRQQVLLVNGWTLSGGDLLAHFFRESRLGEVIGTPTVGGVNFWFFGPRLIDGGLAFLANVAHFGKKRSALTIENRGLEPRGKSQVREDLNELEAGCDNQLEAAVDRLLTKLYGGDS